MLVLRGHEVTPLPRDRPGFSVRENDRIAHVLFSERVDEGFEAPTADGETVVLALELAGPPPEGCSVLDLIGRQAHGPSGLVLDSVREFCRKRGIRFEPGPWRYRGGLV